MAFGNGRRQLGTAMGCWEKRRCPACEAAVEVPEPQSTSRSRWKVDGQWPQRSFLWVEPEQASNVCALGEQGDLQVVHSTDCEDRAE